MRRLLVDLVPDQYAPTPGRDVRFADGVERRHAWAAAEVRSIRFRQRCARSAAAWRPVGVAFTGLGLAMAGATRSFTEFVTALDSGREPR